MRAKDKGSDEKIDDPAARDTLENEISALRCEISYLKQRCSSGSKDEGKKVAILQARVSQEEKEISLLKEHLDKDRIRAENERKMAKVELDKATEALKTAKAEMARAEILQADNEREMKMKESTIRVPLENEISSLKSQITVLQQQAVSVGQNVNKEAISDQKAEIRKQKQAVLGAKDVDKEIILLQECISDKVAEIKRLNELLQIEKYIADSERKKAEEMAKKVDEKEVYAEKLLAEYEKELEVKEAAVRLSLENEISSLKSQIELLQQKAFSGVQDVSKNAQAQDLNKKTVLSQEHLSEREAEINRLKKLLQEEKESADSEKKKSDKQKCWANTVLADNERGSKEIEQDIQIGLEDEISAFKSQIHLLQQDIAAKDKKGEVRLIPSLVSEKEAEIYQLQKLVDKERTRAESEKKKAEAWKRKVTESQKIAMAQKSRADEERRLASIERKKVEEARIQLERLRAEVNDLRANAEADALTSKQANEKLETETEKVINERQHTDMEMAKAKARSKLLETVREIVEEKVHDDCLSQQLKEDRGHMNLRENVAKHASFSNSGKGPGDLVKHVDLEAVKLKGSPQLEVTNRESGASKPMLNCLQCEEVNKKLEDVKQEAEREKERADIEMRKAEYQRGVAEAYGEKDRVKTNWCEQLAHELENERCKTEELKKEIHELVSSKTLVKAVDNKNGKTDTTRMKLLKKELKLEKMQAKHAEQVASLEKDRNMLLRQEIWRIKEEFSRISDHLDILDKCSSQRDVGLSEPEKVCSCFLIELVKI